MQIFDDRICTLGEGPLWHPVREQLYWFDILGKRLLTQEKGQPKEWQFDENVSAAGWVSETQVLMATETALNLFDLETGVSEQVVALEADNPITRSNDGRADPFGGFWIGTMGKGAEAYAGSIYRYYRGEVRRLFDRITVSNAICFSPDGALMYFADSAGSAIYAYDYDGQRALGQGRVFADIKGYGVPDGSTVDAEGYLWNARFGGRSVLRFTPEGHLDKVITLPVPNVTCCCIGGANLDRLFITTARVGMDAQALKQAPQAGGLFALDIPVKGLPHGQFIPQERTST